MYQILNLLCLSFIVQNSVYADFEESGVTIKNTSAYSIKSFELPTKPLFLKREKCYYANKLHGAISISINATELKEDLEQHLIQLNSTLSNGYQLKLCNYSSLCHLYHNSVMMFETFVSLKEDILSSLKTINKYLTPDDIDQRDPFSFAISLASLAGTAVNRLSIHRLQTQVRNQNIKIEKFSKIFDTTNKLFKRISGTIQITRQRVRALSISQMYQQMAFTYIQNVEGITRHYENILLDLENVVSGKFPSHIVKFSDVIQEYIEYENLLRVHNMLPLIAAKDVLKADFHANMHKGVIYLMFDVPISRADQNDVFEVYEFINIPIMYKNKMVVIKESNEMIIYNRHTKHLTEISKDTLELCDDARNSENCNVITKTSPNTCLESLFSYDLSIHHEKDLGKCKVMIVDKAQGSITSVNEHLILLHLTEIGVVSFTCSDGKNDFMSHSDSFPSGFYLINVHIACKVTTQIAEAYLNKNSMVSPKVLNRKIDLSFGKYFENVMNEAEKSNISMPNKLLNELNEQVEDLKSHAGLSDTQNDHSIMFAGTALAFAIAFMLLVTCLLLRYGKRKLREQECKNTKRVSDFILQNSIK